MVIPVILKDLILFCKNYFIMKKLILIIITLTFLIGCRKQNTLNSDNKTYLKIISNKEDEAGFFTALYFVNKEKQYNIDTGLEYKDSWNFNSEIDSLLSNNDRKELILNQTKNNSKLIADIKHWIEIEKMINFPSTEKYSSEIFTNAIYSIDETKSLFKKYLKSSQQDYSSLDENQKGEIYFDTINYLFKLPENKLLAFLSSYFMELKKSKNSN